MDGLTPLSLRTGEGEVGGESVKAIFTKCLEQRNISRNHEGLHPDEHTEVRGSSTCLLDPFEYKDRNSNKISNS